MTRLSSQRTALVLVDLMVRVVAQPLAPRSGETVVVTARQLARHFREADALVIAMRTERPGVVEQPPGSDLVRGIAEASDLVVVKRTMGGFHGTDLHEQLQRRGIDTLVLAGIATNLGVESTARAASDHDYELAFAENAMTAFTDDEHQAAIALDFPHLGTVVPATTIELLPP